MRRGRSARPVIFTPAALQRSASQRSRATPLGRGALPPCRSAKPPSTYCCSSPHAAALHQYEHARFGPNRRLCGNISKPESLFPLPLARIGFAVGVDHRLPPALPEPNRDRTPPPQPRLSPRKPRLHRAHQLVGSDARRHRPDEVRSPNPSRRERTSLYVLSSRATRTAQAQEEQSASLDLDFDLDFPIWFSM